MNKKRTKILKFGDRLRYLFNNHVPVIKNAPALARAMYSEGIIKYPDNCKNKEERHSYAARTIDIHLKSDSVEGIKGEWIKRYCDFFRCSADFLFGYIPLPTHDETNIQEKVNLSHSAIRKITDGNNRLLDIFINSKDYYEMDYMFDQMIQLWDSSKKHAARCYELKKEFEEKKGNVQEEQRIDSEYRLYERLIVQNSEKCDGSTYRIGIKFGNILEECRKSETEEIQSVLNIKSKFT